MEIASVPAVAWARGVAGNTAAPADVLLRLLDPAGEPAWGVLCGGRALPEEVVSAIVGGDQVLQKKYLAGNPHATPEQRGRLATDPDPMVRLYTAQGPRQGTWLVRPLPEDALDAFYTAVRTNHPTGLVTPLETMQELVHSAQVSGQYYTSRLDPPDPTWMDPVANEARLDDHWTHARTSIMLHHPMTHAVAERELADPDGRLCMSSNPYTPPDIVERLAADPDPSIRKKVAARFGLPKRLRAQLRDDPDQEVRTIAAAFSVATTKAQHLAVIRHMFGTSAWPALQYAPASQYEPPSDLGDPDWYVRAAESDNVLLRRAAACDARLPPDQVRRLAADPDPEVRSLLAHSHPDAPPELMIEVFLAEPKHRAVMMQRSRMPRTGLAHLLGHPDAQVRAFAAADPTLPLPPVAQLDDDEELVRRAAAANPLLPSELLDRLLQDARHAEGAAANPQLDADRLHRLLDGAGIPR